MTWLESKKKNFVGDTRSDRKPMKFTKHRSNVGRTRDTGNKTRRSVLDALQWSFEVILLDRPKRRELQLGLSKRDVTNAWIRRWAVFWSRNLRILLIFLKATKEDLHIISTFWDMVRDESMTTPRFRAIFAGSITDCPIFTLICGTQEQYLEWKCRSSVLESFKESLFLSDQVLTSFKQSSSFCTAWERSLALKVIYNWTSSAYIMHDIPCANMISWRGDINAVKINGPATGAHNERILPGTHFNTWVRWSM